MKKFISFSNFSGDLLGGVTAGIVALPLALAFGVSSGLGASAGLYGAIFIGFLAALFGGTPTQISGPTAPMTAVSMMVVAGIVASFDGVLKDALPAILTVFLLGGLFQILMGVLKLGSYIKYIPQPVVSGFMTAIGVIILITQILPSLGYYPKDDANYVSSFIPQAEEVILDHILHDEAKEGVLVLEDFRETIDMAQAITPEQFKIEAKSIAGKNSSGVLGTFKVLPQAIKNISWLEVILSLSTIFIIYTFKKVTTAVPSTLIALIAVSGVAIFLDLDYRAIEAIPTGLPVPNFGIFTEFNLAMITPYIFTAITLALLGSIDSLLTSVVSDNMTKTKHASNQELIGQGIGNTVASIFGGIPGAGATIRTVVNIKSGGKTKLSGIFAAILLLVILLVLGPVASKIPAAVLSGILITVGIGVMDYKGLKAIPSMAKTEVFVMMTVLILSVFWNLVFAVGIGLIIAALIFMKEMGDLTEKKSNLNTFSSAEEIPEECILSETMQKKVYLLNVSGPLFFGSTSQFQKLASEVPEHTNTVVMGMSRMEYIDQSGIYALEEAFISWEKMGKDILLVGVAEQPKLMFESCEITRKLMNENHEFHTFEQGVDWIQSQLKTVNN